MAGLVPAIPIDRHCIPKRDARDKRGHDEVMKRGDCSYFFNSARILSAVSR